MQQEYDTHNKIPRHPDQGIVTDFKLKYVFKRQI